MKTLHFLFYFLVLSLIVSCKSDSQSDLSLDLMLKESQISIISDEISNQSEICVNKAIALYLAKNSNIKSDSVLTFKVSDSSIVAIKRDESLYPSVSRLPNVVVVDFGNGASQRFGYSFKGKLIVNYGDTLSTVAANKKIFYDNFYVNDQRLKGSKSIKYFGSYSVNKNNLDSVSWSISSSDTLLSNVRTSVENKKQMQSTSGLSYLINGYSTGMINDHKFVLWISASNPIQKSSVFAFPIQGVISLTSNYNSGSLNFGTGALDAQAIFTDASGDTKSVTLSK